MSNTSGLSAGRPSRAPASKPPQTLSALVGDDEEKGRVNFELALSKRRWLKAYVAREGTTITDLFTGYVDSLIERDR